MLSAPGPMDEVQAKVCRRFFILAYAAVNGIEFRAGGDVVVKIENATVQDADDLVRAVGRLLPGQVALFTVFREGRRTIVPVQLGQRPSKPALKC